MQIIIDIPEDVLKRTVFYREFKDLNDCITTIKALEKATPVTPTVDTPTEQGNITTERLDTPTIYAVPVKRGKWVFNPSDAFEAMFAKPKCSECGFESADGGNYCPNCGARMDEDV